MRNSWILGFVGMALLGGACWGGTRFLRDRFEVNLSETLHRPVKIQKVGFTFPLGIRLLGLKVDLGLSSPLEGKGTLALNGTGEMMLSVEVDRLEGLSWYLKEILGSAPTQGSCRLRSDVSLQRGAIVAKIQATATGVTFPRNEPTTFGLSGNELAKLLADREGKIRLDWVFQGSLEKPGEWSTLFASALRDSIDQTLRRSVQKVLAESERGRSPQKEFQEAIESLGR